MKKILKFFHLNSKKTAKTAKERLQIVVSHQRATETSPEFLPELRKELLNVICKYITIDIDQINVNLQKVGNCSILELNVTIPELLDKKNKTESCITEEAVINKKNLPTTAVTEEEELLDVELADV